MYNIYLAARYSRIDEMKYYKRELEELGHHVTSRWVDDEEGTERHVRSEMLLQNLEQANNVAQEDLTDIDYCSLFVLFTEPERVLTRGGRHFETAYAAFVAGAECFLIGARENVFHALPNFEQFDTWAEFLTELNEQM